MSGLSSRNLVADVKCYYCGHVTGQIVARRGEPLKVRNFVPRAGYTGPELKPGERLRCERCNGPVFLEDVASLHNPEAEQALRRRLQTGGEERAA